MPFDLAGRAAFIGEVGETSFSVGINPESRVDVELLRDLLVAEHQQQTGKLDEATDTTLANALQMALRRLGTAPAEPLDLAARVIGTRTDVGLGDEYARVADVWVNSAGHAHTWADLVVEYDELTVHGLGAP